MRLERLTSALLFALCGTLFLTASVVSAGPKEDVAAATMTWAQTLGQNDPDKVVLLYASDAVLWELSLLLCERIDRRYTTTSSRHSKSYPVSRSHSASN